MSKPPIGIIPEYIWIDMRRQDIRAAIGRYTAAGTGVPWEWLNELDDLNERTR